MLEEENTTLKNKLTIFKEKLREATLLIENMTEQLFELNKNNDNLKGTYTFYFKNIEIKQNFRSYR